MDCVITYFRIELLICGTPCHPRLLKNHHLNVLRCIVLRYVWTGFGLTKMFWIILKHNSRELAVEVIYGVTMLFILLCIGIDVGI